MGRIKLELPNKFNVYLHDTPDKALFEKSKRQLSHGCVRVEQILPLDSYTLAADLSATDKITKAIETGETATISLKKRIPVYFVYWTAVPAADGSLKYYPDVYGRDRRLIASMRNKHVRIAGIDPACMKG